MKMGVLALCVASFTLAGCATTPEVVAGRNWAGPTETPDGQEFTPEAANRRGIEGMVMLGCAVGEGDKLTNCRILQENPAGWGFGQAALRMQDGVVVHSEPLPLGQEIQMPVFFCQYVGSPCSRAADARREKVRAQAAARAAARAAGQSTSP